MYCVEQSLLPKEFEHAFACAKQHLLHQSAGFEWVRCARGGPLLGDSARSLTSASTARSGSCGSIPGVLRPLLGRPHFA